MLSSIPQYLFDAMADGDDSLRLPLSDMLAEQGRWQEMVLLRIPLLPVTVRKRLEPHLPEDAVTIKLTVAPITNAPGCVNNRWNSQLDFNVIGALNTQEFGTGVPPEVILLPFGGCEIRDKPVPISVRRLRLRMYDWGWARIDWDDIKKTCGLNTEQQSYMDWSVWLQGEIDTQSVLVCTVFIQDYRRKLRIRQHYQSCNEAFHEAENGWHVRIESHITDKDEWLDNNRLMLMGSRAYSLFRQHKYEQALALMDELLQLEQTFLAFNSVWQNVHDFIRDLVLIEKGHIDVCADD